MDAISVITLPSQADMDSQFLLLSPLCLPKLGKQSFINCYSCFNDVVVYIISCISCLSIMFASSIICALNF